MSCDFQGRIEFDVCDFVVDWDVFFFVKFWQGVLNVLVVFYDDIGMVVWFLYGGWINMLIMDCFVQNGLIYFQWYIMVFCLFICLMFFIGCNYYFNGFVMIFEFLMGFFGYNFYILDLNVMMVYVFCDVGWLIFWVGKNYNVLIDEWMVGVLKKYWFFVQGYDWFYGFIGGEINNWYLLFVEDNYYIDQLYFLEDGYYFLKDFVDQVLLMICDVKQIELDKLWYLWFCFGVNYVLYYVLQEYIDKYKGVFDDGYEVYCEWVLVWMVEKGIFLEDMEFIVLNFMLEGLFLFVDEVWLWDLLNDEEKVMFLCMVEVYVGFSEYIDVQVGCIVDYFEELGQFDNMLIIYCVDNGVFGEGSLNGLVNEGKIFGGYLDDEVENFCMVDKFGLFDIYNYYLIGWVVVFFILYKMFKCYIYQGGVCDLFVIYWFVGICVCGEVCYQYYYFIDIVLMIFEVCGIEFFDVYNGVEQMLFFGVLMMYLFDVVLDVLMYKQIQYYEMFGQCGIWYEGWKVVMVYGLISGKGNFDEDEWEFYYIDVDCVEVENIVDQYLEKVEEFKVFWMEEVKVNVVLFFNDLQIIGNLKDFEMFVVMEFYQFVLFFGQFVYYLGMSEVLECLVVNMYGVFFKIVVEVEFIVEIEGVIFVYGFWFGGYVFVVKDGQVYYVYNFLGILFEDCVLVFVFVFGMYIIGVEFIKEGMGEYCEGVGLVKFYIDDQQVGEKQICIVFGYFFLCGEGLMIGCDSVDLVLLLYGYGFDFVGGEIIKVVFDIVDDVYLDFEVYLVVVMVCD